jgi:Flp pilus assembly protein TadD
VKKQLLIACALIALCFASHAPALRAGFVWDDTALILRDPLIRSWRLIPEQFQHFLFTDATPSNFYRPLQRVTYTLEYWAGVFQPSLFHFTNVLLHAGAAIALFAFSLAFLELGDPIERRRLIVAGVVAVVWVLHPLHSAVVDYVAGRADSLAALFGFSALFCAVRATRNEGYATWKLQALSGTLLLASALSKESGLMFSAVSLAFFLLRKDWVGLRRAAVAVAFVFTIYATLRAQAGEVEVPRLSAPAPALVRPIIAARALAEYTGLFIVPANLHMDRDVESRPLGMNEPSMTISAWRELQTLGGIAIAGALIWWFLRARQRYPSVFCLLCFAAITYLLVSGFFALNGTAAEHWIYVPSAFLLLALAQQLASLVYGARVMQIATAVALLWIGGLGLRSFVRAQDWADQRTFFERTIASGGDSARMLINLGALELNENNFERAKTLLQRALEKEPDQPFALVNLSAVALMQRDFPTARSFLERARKNPVTEAQAHELFAVLDYKEKAKVDLLRLRLAARSSPPTWSIERRYVRALDQTGNTMGAIAELKAILRIDYFRAESWQLLSAYLAKIGRVPEAAKAIAQARDYDVHLGEHSVL